LAGTEAGPGPAVDGQPPTSADEPLAAALEVRGPRVRTRTLVVAVLLLVVLLLASLVVAFVVLHQPRLTPVPVPSVSSIA
jgi:hypothetical protein